MTKINYDLFVFHCNIANYKEWEDSRLFEKLADAEAYLKHHEDTFHYVNVHGITKSTVGHPVHVLRGYKWALEVQEKMIHTLKGRGSMEKTENDIWLENALGWW